MSETMPTTTSSQPPLAETLEIATTNFALPRRDAVLGGRNEYEQFLEETGYKDFELHPIRSRIVWSLARGAITVDGLVGSLHESFREQRLGDIGHDLQYNREELLRYAPAFIGLPHVEDSMEVLARIQNSAPTRLPTVVYALPRFGNNQKAFYGQYQGQLLVQPEPQHLQLWGIDPTTPSAVQGLIDILDQNGFGVCLDMTHWTKTAHDGSTLPAWEKSFPELMRSKAVKELHVNPYRPDIGAHSSTEQLRNILAGNIGNTVLGDQLLCIAEQGPLPRIVVELESNHARQVIKDDRARSSSNTRRDLELLHKDLVRALTEHITDASPRKAQS